MPPKKLKILYYDGAISYGGALVVLRHLFKAIDRTEFAPRLIANAPPIELNLFFDSADISLVQHRPLNYASQSRWMRSFENSPTWIRRLVSYAYTLADWTLNLPSNIHLLMTFLREKPDLLHINNSILPLWIARYLKIPTVWQIHVIPDPSSPILHRLMHHIDAFIAVSDYVAEAAKEAGYDASKIVVIPNPTPCVESDLQARVRLETAYPACKNKLVIVHAGRLVRWKGQLEFLKAFRILQSEYPDSVALIVGDDNENLNSNYKEQLLEYARTNLLPDTVLFTGHLNNVQEVMQAGDLLVHSSTSPEPFGLVIVEAMSAGTPVVASSLGAPSQIIKHGVNGMLVDVKDTDKFSQTLKTLASDSALRSTLASNALKDAQQFSPENYARLVTNTYKAVLSHELAEKITHTVK